MENKIKELLKGIVNPQTQKSLLEEDRFISIDLKNDQVWIKYNRDQISIPQKREIEEKIKEALASEFDSKSIFVLSVSSDSKSATTSKASPAQLEVGHAKPAPSRKVEGVKKIIAIGSGKGGVGKSTFTVNLACSLVEKGLKVGLLDADIYGPSLPKLLGQEDAQTVSNAQKKIIPVEAYGLKFVSFGLFIEQTDAVIWRGPMLGGVINQFLFDVDWSGLDYLLIDLPPGTGDVQLSMIQATPIDGAVVVSTPQDVALLDSVRGYEMFKKLNIPNLAFVENMSTFICNQCGQEHSIFGKGGVEARAKELEVDFLGKLPLETTLRECSDQGHPYMSQKQFAQKRLYEAYTNVSENFLKTFPLEAVEKKKGIFSRLFHS